MRKQIIAMGGGGFSMEPDNPILDEYFLKQTRKRNPSVCFVPTATGDSEPYIVKFYTAFNKLKCRPCHLSLFRPPDDLKSFVMSQDIIYVGGGSTKNLLALWREWGLDKHMEAAYRKGTILGGVSAGSLCWYSSGLSDSVPGKNTIISGLGLIKESHTPHSNRTDRCKRYKQLIAKGKLEPGIAADDGVALHYIDGHLHRIVSSRPDASAYYVKCEQGKVMEENLEITYLGNEKTRTNSNRGPTK